MRASRYRQTETYTMSSSTLAQDSTFRASSPSLSTEKALKNDFKEKEGEKDPINHSYATPPITTRRAKLSDSKTLGTILAAGFIDDDVFGEYLFPHRCDYPDDYRLQFARTMRSYMYKRGHRVRVAVDTESSRVVGVASWERQGKTPKKSTTADATNPIFTLFKRLSVKTVDTVSTILHPDRSVSKEHQKAFDAEAVNYKHYWSGRRAETWYLSFLAVDPDYRHHGAGRTLVEEGIRWGETDRVCVSLISSECGEGFYRKLGFVDVGFATKGALKGLGGGNIKFYEEYLEGFGQDKEGAKTD